MIIQGHFIIHGKFGYRHSEREKQKMNNARRQVNLFKEENDRGRLSGALKIKELKLALLFEEPCSLYEGLEDGVE